MTLFQIFFSIIGIGFFSAGICFLKKAKIWSIIALLIGACFIYSMLFGGLSKSDDKQNEIRNLKFEEIFDISIVPSKRNNALTEDTVLISSNSEIKQIQESLIKTKETLRINPISDWGCVLIIHKRNLKEIFISISQNGNQTILELYSKGEYGNNYGTMINNELGFILKGIIENRKSK